LLQRGDRRSRVVTETDEGLQASPSRSPTTASAWPDVGLEAEPGANFSSHDRNTNVTSGPVNDSREVGADQGRAHPALPLCHPSMLRRSSWSKSEDTGAGCYVTKAAVIAHLSATSEDVEELWQDVHFPPEDAVECSEACNLLVDFVKHFGGVLPPSSDLGCYTLNGTTRCDIDLRPNTVVKSLGPAMYAGGSPDEGPLWAGTSTADRASSSISSSTASEEGDGEAVQDDADYGDEDDVQETYVDLDSGGTGKDEKELELNSEAVLLLQQQQQERKHVVLAQVVHGGEKLQSRWTWSDLVSPAYWVGSGENETDDDKHGQVGEPTSRNNSVTRVKREHRHSSERMEADDLGSHRNHSHHRRLRFFRHLYRNAYEGHGAVDIDSDETAPTGISQADCIERCSDDPECECSTFHPSTGTCWKRGQCNFLKWAYSLEFEVLSKPRARPFRKHGHRSPMRKEPCSYSVWELVQRLCASFRIYISSGRDLPVTSNPRQPKPDDSSLALLQNASDAEAEEAIAASDIKARAWASTVLSEMTAWHTPEFRERWFGGDGNLTSDEVRDRVLQTMNFVSRELMEGMHYIYPADDAEYTACGENVVAYVWKWVSSEEGYYETTGPICNATDAFSKRCGLADDGKYFVYLCKYWYESIDPSTQVATLVHEASHHAGPSDISYNAEVMQQLTQAEQLDNAANYHNFAQDVVDSAWDCVDEEELTGAPFDSMDCAGSCACESLVSYCEDDDESIAAAMQSKCQGTCGSCSAPTTTVSQVTLKDSTQDGEEAATTSPVNVPEEATTTTTTTTTIITTTTTPLTRVRLTTATTTMPTSQDYPGTRPTPLTTTTKEPLIGDSPIPQPPPAWTSPVRGWMGGS